MKKSCIPNIFTFINLSCGVLSLLSTFDRRFLLAGLLIILAGIVDRYDGRVARYLNVSSELGKELDSLADLVSFGVAPSVLIFILCDFDKLGPMGIIGYVLLLAFPICGAYRLARYNVSTFDGNFRGIPITIAGCFIALYAILRLYVELPIILTAIVMIVGAYLMVSNVKLKKL